MGLDVGDKTIGVAISDGLRLTAQPRPTIRRQELAADIEQLRRIAAENDVHEIVVGLPVHLNGRQSRQGEKTARFAAELERALELPVILWDERLTSVAAEQHLEEMGLNWRKRREHIDKIAAMIILQTYLDSRPRQSA
jgi:putative Holliday junction resolvase